MEEAEAGRRPVVVRLNVPLLPEFRAVRAHDLDGPSNELVDLNEGTRGVLLSELLDLSAWQCGEQLVEVVGRLNGHLRLRP